jgi:hydroxyethylthiazole kinase-like uncharacterized protein yjeF
VVKKQIRDKNCKLVVASTLPLMTKPQKIFSAQQIKEADRYTIQHEPIASIDLMERAAVKCFEWISQHFSKEKKFLVFCGPGNNGGDGLAIARLLLVAGYTVEVYTLATTGKYSEDFLINHDRLQKMDPAIFKQVSSIADLPPFYAEDIFIDAIFGTGLSKPITGLAAEIIKGFNSGGGTVIAIDMPSGLFADKASDHSSVIVRATYTLSFQFPKLSFLFAEYAAYTGDWKILDIGISQKFIDSEPATHRLLTVSEVGSMLLPRKKFSHKGTYGHALLIAGSYGKIGAAVLAVKACLRSGAGLLTVHLPKCGYTIMQVANPEAMVSVDSHEEIISDEITVTKFSAVGIGPGTGVEDETQKAFYHLLKQTTKPLLLDADALNILSLHKDWLEQVPAYSILTPHPKEFERLAGKAANDFERHQMQIGFSKKYTLIIVLKGAHTCISIPSGECYFNTTGNSGMAKGGSGDVLTGLITGLLAQGYDSLSASLLGVFIHGYAGDMAKDAIGEIGMTAGDVCDFLPAAFKEIARG